MKTSGTDRSQSLVKSILFVALGVVALLMVPLIAMQFDAGPDWSPFDFAAMGVLLFGTGLAFVLITHHAKTLTYRLAVLAALGGALLLIWINLAVGIIGSEDNPANVMYMGVIAVLVGGALIAQLRPLGMSRALYATAAAQAIVTAIALVTEPEPAIVQLVMLNGFFVLLWIGSGVLFQRAHEAQAAG